MEPSPQQLCLADLVTRACVLALVLVSLACDRNPINAFCEARLATSEGRQAKERAAREAEEAKTEATLAEAADPRQFISRWEGVGFKEFNFDLRWRDGQLLYKVSATPPRPRKVADALSLLWAPGAQGPGFQITLLDQDGFQTQTFFVSLWDMTLDETGKRLEGIGSAPCSAKAYLKTANWTARTIHFQGL